MTVCILNDYIAWFLAHLCQIHIAGQTAARANRVLKVAPLNGSELYVYLVVTQ